MRAKAYIIKLYLLLLTLFKYLPFFTKTFMYSNSQKIHHKTPLHTRATSNVLLIECFTELLTWLWAVKIM
jgi:hypothetical protein